MSASEDDRSANGLGEDNRTEAFPPLDNSSIPAFVPKDVVDLALAGRISPEQLAGFIEVEEARQVYQAEMKNNLETASVYEYLYGWVGNYSKALLESTADSSWRRTINSAALDTKGDKFAFLIQQFLEYQIASIKSGWGRYQEVVASTKGFNALELSKPR